MANDSPKLPREGNQDTYAALWDALGLPDQSQGQNQRHDDLADGSDYRDATKISYEVLVRYHVNDLKHKKPAANRRRNPRHEIGDKCQYRINGMATYGQGCLHNISASGFAIGVHRKLTLGRTITILIETRNSRELPLIVQATVAREAGTTDDGLFRYGCQIDRVSNPNG